MHHLQDRRHQPRYNITEAVINVEDNKNIGYTSNINAFGMMLVSKTRYPVETDLRVKILIPISHNERAPVTLQAECCWETEIKGASLFHSGFRFNYTNQTEVQFTKILFDSIDTEATGLPH